MSKPIHSFVRYLKTLAVTTGALAVIPASAAAADLDFSSTLPERVEDLEASVDATADAETNAALQRFAKVTFIKFGPYSKLAPRPRPAPRPVSAALVFEEVRNS